MPADLVLRSGRVVLPEGERPATIQIAGGVIKSIKGYGNPFDIDVGDVAILPGLVDTHVHINEPGRTEWEGFETATRAAAAGGVTTVIEMPLNSIPATTTVAGYEEKMAAAQGQCFVDVGFWGGVVPGNEDQLRELYQAGCFGFKCFLSPSGVDEFQNALQQDLRKAMPILAELGAVLQVHAELPGYLLEARGDARVYDHYLCSRPSIAETAAIDVLIRLSRETGCRVHVVHLATSAALDALRRARKKGLEITVETCPHYLTFAAEQIQNGATEFKCAPPIRDAMTREALWAALGEGLIDSVVSDHSPCPPELKLRGEGDFFAAWGGISSLQLGLAAVWTEAHKRGFSLVDVSRWMSSGPAKLARLFGRKGAIAPGFDADLIFFDPGANWVVDPAALHHRHKVTPYAGQSLFGVVKETYLRGEPVLLDGSPQGRVLRRGTV